MTTANKILIIVSERIGDVIFCTPAIHLLRLAHPQAIINVIALSHFSAQVFDHNPDVNQVYVLPDKDVVKELANTTDLVIDLHNSDATIAYAKRLNKKTFTSPRSAENQHQSVVATAFMQTVVGNAVTNFPEHYRLFPQSSHHEKIKSLLLSNGAQFTDKEILIGCHMGNYKTAERAARFWKRNIYSKKTWPVEKFATLQQMLYQENPNIKLVLTGSPSEQGLTKKLHRKYPNLINIVGQTKLLELAALMPLLKVFLTGDTGPLHVAAATTVPIVALLGPTSAVQTGPRPLREHHVILQENPLTKLDVAVVKEALLGFLSD